MPMKMQDIATTLGQLIRCGFQIRTQVTWVQARLTQLCGAGLLATAALYPSQASAQVSASGEWRDAKRMFTQTCALCHGTGVGPEIRGRQLPPEYISYVVMNGLRAMPAFRPTDFSAAELAILAKFVSESPAPAPAKPKEATK